MHDWCGPCKVLTPVMENVKSKFSQVSFENVNIDTDFETAQKYYVRSVPTVIIEKNGEEVQRFVGVQSEHHTQTQLMKIYKILFGFLKYFSYINLNFKKYGEIYGFSLIGYDESHPRKQNSHLNK